MSDENQFMSDDNQFSSLSLSVRIGYLLCVWYQNRLLVVMYGSWGGGVWLDCICLWWIIIVV